MDNIFKYTYSNKVDPSFDLNLSNLVTIYLPLIDSKAMSLYLELVNEKNFDSVFKTNNKDLIDLLKILSISFDEFDTYRRKLEAFGLIKTYVSYDHINKIRSFLFEINEPLSFHEFMTNNKFKKSFINKVGMEKYEELEFYYNQSVSKSYRELSDNYDDVFEEFSASKEYVFDFDLLNKNLSSIAKTNIYLNDEVKKIINFYFTSFSVSIRDIEKAVINSTSVDGEDFIVDSTLLEVELSSLFDDKNNMFSSDVIEIKRVNNFFTKLQDDLVKKEMFIQYRNISPESYLSSLQKYQIGKYEIDLINILRNEFHLKNEIINILLDYSVMKTHGKVNDNYIYKVAKSLNLNNIKTVSEAYNYFYNVSTNTRYSKKNKTNEEDSLEFIELFN